MIIRPISHQDLPALHQIAIESGPGFTSLMADIDYLAQKIQRSIDSFGTDIQKPGKQSYLFVLEDERTGDIMGISGITAAAGLDSPLYHYHKSQLVNHSRALGIFKRFDVLNMCNHYTGCTEVCTLFLRPQFRRAHAGKLLSKVRFLFMAQHPQRFADTVIAEMRGVSTEEGHSPFWNWFNEHFVDLDFAAVTELVGTGNNGFIAELIPKYPLYTQLLRKDAREVIGQVHEQTRPALHMLECEGFRHKGYIDLFDAGPTVEAEFSQISSIATSVQCQVQAVSASTPLLSRHRNQNRPELLAIANTRTGDFRATVTDQGTYLPQHNLLQLPATLVDSLGLQHGGSARCLKLTATGARTLPEAVTASGTQVNATIYAN